MFDTNNFWLKGGWHIFTENHPFLQMDQDGACMIICNLPDISKKYEEGFRPPRLDTEPPKWGDHEPYFLGFQVEFEKVLWQLLRVEIAKGVSNFLIAISSYYVIHFPWQTVTLPKKSWLIPH